MDAARTAQVTRAGNRFLPRIRSTRQPAPRIPLSLIPASLVVLALLLSGVRAEAASCEISPAAQEGSFDRVQSVVQIEGTLKLNADGKRVHQLPLEVSAKLSYVERHEAVEPGVRRSVRHYRLAAAEMRIAETPLRFELRDERRLIAALWGGVNRTTLFCPRGPLTQEELDLIDVPGNSLCLDSLAPEEEEQEVVVGQAWACTPATLVALLNLDAVARSDVQNKLVRTTADTALVELAGTLEGVVSGASTEIELKGQWEFDRKRRRVRRLTLSVREDRAIGHCEPGFNVISRIRVVLDPAPAGKSEAATPENSASPVATEEATGAEALSDELLSQLTLLPTAQNKLIQVASPQSGISLLHDRRWKVMADTPEGLVLRHVAEGELLAQCNITPLAPQAAASPLPLDQFQEDVEQTLGERLQQFVEASETQLERLRILRVVATGTVSELPIRWVYYHVSDPEGRRASLVFTLEESVAEQFGTADRPIVESLEMRDTRPAKVSADDTRPE